MSNEHCDLMAGPDTRLLHLTVEEVRELIEFCLAGEMAAADWPGAPQGECSVLRRLEELVKDVG